MSEQAASGSMSARMQGMLVTGLFIIALGSGVILGMGVGRKPAPRGGGERPLSEELNLTPEQREKMREIWEGQRSIGQKFGEARRQLSRDRDAEVVKLLTSEQKAAYDALMEKYNAQVADLNKQREASTQIAVEKTKEMLSPEQRAKYEEMLKKGMHRGPWGGRGAATTSAPATTTAGAK